MHRDGGGRAHPPKPQDFSYRPPRRVRVGALKSALSLILNGGGVAQLKTITTELDKALAGHEDAAKDVLTQVDALAKNLDDHKQAITDAMVEHAGAKPDSVFVVLEDVKKSNWAIGGTLVSQRK